MKDIKQIKELKYNVIEAATKALKEGKLQIDKGSTIKVIFFSGSEEQQIYFNYVGELMNKIYFACTTFGVDVYKYENERFIFVSKDPQVDFNLDGTVTLEEAFNLRSYKH